MGQNILPKRAYKGKDAEMLTATSTLIENCILEKPFLISKRATWVDPFFDDIKARIDNAFLNHLGIDNAAAMREATQFVLALMNQAYPPLSEFKVQVENDLPNRKADIFTELGINPHFKRCRTDQEAMVELLMKFKLNMTPTLQSEIISAGTDLNTITTIISFADQIKNSNISQEVLKGGRRIISASVVNEFNAIYKQVIGISKICTRFFINDKPKAQLFSYTHLLLELNNPDSPPSPPPPGP